jgi:hypothetical protein
MSLYANFMRKIAKNLVRGRGQGWMDGRDRVLKASCFFYSRLGGRATARANGELTGSRRPEPKESASSATTRAAGSHDPCRLDEEGKGVAGRDPSHFPGSSSGGPTRNQLCRQRMRCIAVTCGK